LIKLESQSIDYVLLAAAAVVAIVAFAGAVVIRTNTTTGWTALHTSVLRVGFHLLFFN